MARCDGWCVWLTGLPGSGKSTIANILLELLRTSEIHAQILSSDMLRRLVTPSPEYTEEERETIIADMGAKEDKVSLQRYKGLGEMNPEQLWETTMNPENRTLLMVNIDDAAAADRTFDMLMGSLVPPRKRFIQTHAKLVRNLDI